MTEITQERMREFFIWCPECQSPTFFRQGDLAPRSCIQCDIRFFGTMATDSSTNKDIFRVGKFKYKKVNDNGSDPNG